MRNLFVSIGNQAVPWLETSYDYAVLNSSSPANKYVLNVNNKNNSAKVGIMFKVVNNDIRTMSLASFCFHHCLIWKYSTPYSSVYVVVFEQVHACLKPVLWRFIYTQADRGHHSTVVIVTFEYITTSSNVSYCWLWACIYFLGLIF